MHNVDTDTDHLDGRLARSVSSLTGMLGWNSVGVFDNSEHFDGEMLHVNNGSTIVVLTDPYPEYREFVFLNGEFHHSSDLLSMEYEGVFEDHMERYSEATVYALDDVEYIQRDENGIPQYVAESAGNSESDEDGGSDV